MVVETGSDLGGLFAAIGAHGANYATIAVAGLAFFEAMPRLKQLADSAARRARAAEEQARATERLAEAEEAALVWRTTDVKGADAETPMNAARQWRARVMFDSYLEWRGAGATHYANGGTFEGSEEDRYLQWLRHALIRLEVVLIEAARSGHQAYWEDRIRTELKPHVYGVSKIDLNEFDQGRLRELMRGK